MAAWLTGLTVFAIAAGQRDQQEDDKDSLAGFDGQFSEGSSAESEGGHTLVRSNELTSLLEAITECITTLLRYSIAIRKASSQDIFRKAARTVTWNPAFDVNHCLDKYPKLKETPW